MKTHYLLFLLALFVSCTESAKTKEWQKPTAASEPINAQKTPHEAKALYLNKIRLFPQTDEFYIFLSPIELLSGDAFRALGQRSDSLIYEEDELARYRFPMELAKQTLDFRNIPTEVNVYNEEHELISKATLERVEYLVSFDEGFIAVYKPASSLPEGEKNFYCLESGEVALAKISTQQVKDEGLTEKIRIELNLQPEYVWLQQHVKLQPHNSVLSIYSFAQANGENIAYLTEYKGKELKVLKRLNEDYIFGDLLPIPILVNGMPVLLIQIVLPESGALDEYLVGTYNGTGYDLAENNLLKL